MSSALPALVDTVETRRTLHRVANELARAQQVISGRLALRVLPGGFGTLDFPGDDGSDARLVVEGTLVRAVGEAVAPVREVGEPYDGAAAELLHAWWELGDAVLARLVASYGAAATPVTLWPEHFDVATVITLHDGLTVTLGFSPGDEYCAQPYVYAAPSSNPVGVFWNAFFGAMMRYDEVDPDDADRVVTRFLEATLATLT